MTFQINSSESIHPFAEFNRNLLKAQIEYFDNPVSQLLAKHLILGNQDTGNFLPGRLISSLDHDFCKTPIVLNNKIMQITMTLNTKKPPT